MFQMLHDMPQRDDIERLVGKLIESFRSCHVQFKMLFGKLAGLRAFFDGRNVPSSFLHEMRKVACAGTDVQQAALA